MNKNAWLWDQRAIHQDIASAATSINSAKMARTFSLVKWQSGTRNGDIGGGRYDNATDYLATLGVTNVIFDPFNRTEQHNRSASRAMRGGQCDTVTVNNVLNVIQDADNRARVIAQAADALKPGGTAYFLIYQGNGSGIGRVSKSVKGRTASWQENRKPRDYEQELSARFISLSFKGNLVVAA